MMKKWMAALLAALMVLTMAGCGATTEPQPNEALVSDETILDTESATTIADLLNDWQIEEPETLSFPMTGSWTVREDLMAFLMAYMYQLGDATYENEMNLVDGSTVTYLLELKNGAMTLTTTPAGQTTGETVAVDDFGFINPAMTVASEEEYAQLLSLNDHLDLMFKNYPYQTIYGLYAVCVLVGEEVITIDYYYEEPQMPMY